MKQHKWLHVLLAIIMMLSGSVPAKGTQPDSIVRIHLHYDVERRNFLLWLVPTMDRLARGERHADMITNQKLRTMPTLQTFASPSLQSETLYPGELLSPFHPRNRHLYRYQQSPPTPDSLAYLRFRPLFGRHTQLVRGSALLDLKTGRILKTSFKGEHDQFSFETEVIADRQDSTRFPSSRTTAMFSFFGNRIRSQLTAAMEPVDTATDASKHQERQLMVLEQIWNHLANSHYVETERGHVKVWPVINPSYLSYSQSKGISYKMRLGASYDLSTSSRIEFSPQAGYNFRLGQFFYSLPVNFSYDKHREGRLEMVLGNGNRIGNGVVADGLGHLPEDSLAALPEDVAEYTDQYLSLSNSLLLWPWLRLKTGIVYHRRKAVWTDIIERLGYDTQYNTFSPSISLTLTPWKSNNSPVLSVNYERAIKGVWHSNIDYERWEADLSWRHALSALRTLRLRIGGGFYSRRKARHFVDFSNFRNNYLPGGWGDEWSGDFQLLDSRLYNESDHYLRANASYESPFMVTSWLPFVGRYVSNECFYLNTLLSGEVHPYTEVGYAFTTRFFSSCVFASFEKWHYREIGTKFTVELFNNW